MFRKIVLLFVISFFLMSIAQANEAVDKSKTKRLRVGIMLAQPPFSYVNKVGEYEGLSLKLWEFIAKDLNIDFEYVPLDTNYNGIVQAVYNKQVDMSVVPLSVTYKRMAFIDYSRPYFMNNFGVAVSSQKKSMPQVILFLFIRMLMIMLLFLCISVVVVGVFLWLFERNKKSDDLPPGIIKGLSYSMWVAAGTFLGHSFYKPLSAAGRGIMYFWLFLSLIIMTVVIALATSTLTIELSEEESNISKLSDLKGKKIALEKGSSVIDVALGFGVKPVIVKNTITALKMIERGEVVGFIGDYFLMEYMIESKGIQGVKMAPLTISNDEYAFGFSVGDPLKAQVDKVLVKLQENKVAAGVCIIFLGKKYEQNCVF